MGRPCCPIEPRRKKKSMKTIPPIFTAIREKRRNIYIISQTCCKEWVKDKKRSIVERKETVRISHVCHRNSAVKEKEKKTQ